MDVHNPSNVVVTENLEGEGREWEGMGHEDEKEMTGRWREEYGETKL